ncbi:MAG: hypothetical protein FD180_4025 [Planctomycetota bacterium]|nr:MAG: hypothetical protein FD180_4025 [Planctomycetota bacterium]
MGKDLCRGRLERLNLVPYLYQFQPNASLSPMARTATLDYLACTPRLSTSSATPSCATLRISFSSLETARGCTLSR